MEAGQQGYAIGVVFETQYYGQCAACKGEINPTDRVFYVTQEQLVHRTCPKTDGLKLPIDGANSPAESPSE